MDDSSYSSIHKDTSGIRVAGGAWKIENIKSCLLRDWLAAENVLRDAAGVNYFFQPLPRRHGLTRLTAAASRWRSIILPVYPLEADTSALKSYNPPAPAIPPAQFRNTTIPSLTRKHQR
jgi:hypothetical protein